MISALFVREGGPYFNDPEIDPWDISRNAMLYTGPNKVIAHPPCERWGRYWSGGPSVKNRKCKGDDNGMFAKALWAVRTFGGILEHPEASHAWAWYGLIKPPMAGGWVKADNFGGFTCCVAQGNYGHPAQKLTWLYGVNIKTKELVWGKAKGKMRLELGPRSKEAAKALRSRPDYIPIKRISAIERIDTPVQFKNLLKDLVL